MITSTPRIRDTASGGPAGSIAIGIPIVGGTPPAVLFIGSGSVLAQDPNNFSYNPQVLYNLAITDGSTFNSQLSLTPTSAGMLTNNISTGKSSVLSLDDIRGATLSTSIGITTGTFFTGVGSGGWSGTDGMTISQGTFDQNQWNIKWSDNNLTPTLSQITSNIFGITMEYTDPTGIDAIVQATQTRSRIQFDNGDGNLSQSQYGPSSFITLYVDPNSYSSQVYGTNDQTYHYYVTPYQIYSDEATTFQPGDTLTDDQGNTADVVSDNGNGLIVVTNLNFVSPPAFLSGSTITDQNFNTATCTVDADVYEASHGISQDATLPTTTRYANFIHTITSSTVTDIYEIKVPGSINFYTQTLTNQGSGHNAIFNFNNTENSTVSHQFSNVSSGGSAALQFNFYNGVSQFIHGIVGNANVTYGGLYTPSSARIENTAGDVNYITGASNKRHVWAVGGGNTGNEIATITSAGVGISGSSSSKITTPAAYLEIAAGTATAGTGPLKFNPGTANTSPVAGMVEPVGDKILYTIPTGTARKEITLNDSALTSGSIPIATTNGRLQDGFVYAEGTYTPTASNTSNITAVTPLTTRYVRIGNVVTFSGQVVIDPTTTATFTSFELSLPIASNFGAATDAAGTGFSGNVQEGFQILSSAANDTLLIWMTPINVTSQTYSFSGSYQII